MPAIRYRKNGSFVTVSHAKTSNSDLVAVLLKSGESELVEWLGFLCVPATKQIIGKPAKIAGNEVTRDDGGLGSVWHPVGKEEFVLGWIIERYTKDRMIPGVYGVVNKNSWPVVMPKEPRPTSRKLNPTVTEIIRRKPAA